MTFELHPVQQPLAQNKFTQLFCEYAWYTDPVSKTHFIGDLILKNLFALIQDGKVDSNWGGFIISSYAKAWKFDWIYYGDPNKAKQNAQDLLSLNYPYNTSQSCSIKVYDTFWDYESTVPADSGGNQYIFNALVPKSNLTANYADLISEFVNSSTVVNDGYMAGICAVLQGGKVNEKADDYTSVTPAFRHNYFEMAMGAYWSGDDQNVYNNAIKKVDEFEPKLREYGMGIYGNEENKDCVGCDWKGEFWGNNYERLLAVKKKWDPEQVFWCNHCVGDGDY